MGKKGKKADRDNLILAGFSFTGKTVVAERVAERMKRRLVDSDKEIAELAGKSIQQIFAEDGESRFRELEQRVLQWACRRRKAVIAIGGGAVVDARNRDMFFDSGVLICLEATPQTIDDAVAVIGESINPINDVRASSDFRREMAGVVIRRGFRNILSKD